MGLGGLRFFSLNQITFEFLARPLGFGNMHIGFSSLSYKSKLWLVFQSIAKSEQKVG